MTPEISRNAIVSCCSCSPISYGRLGVDVLWTAGLGYWAGHHSHSGWFCIACITCVANSLENARRASAKRGAGDCMQLPWGKLYDNPFSSVSLVNLVIQYVRKKASQKSKMVIGVKLQTHGLRHFWNAHLLQEHLQFWSAYTFCSKHLQFK